MIGSKAIIIPGPRKCGTSTLFKLLKDHPQIDCPYIKEPHFFTLTQKIINDNISWYQDLYPHKLNKPFLDGSTLYFSSNRAKENIKKYMDNPLIIIILRDPAKRVYSSYLHMVKKVPKPELRDFKKILKKIEGVQKFKLLIQRIEF